MFKLHKKDIRDTFKSLPLCVYIVILAIAFNLPLYNFTALSLGCVWLLYTAQKTKGYHKLLAMPIGMYLVIIYLILLITLNLFLVITLVGVSDEVSVTINNYVNRWGRALLVIFNFSILFFIFANVKYLIIYRSLRLVLIVFIAVFIIQYLLFIFTGKYLDIVNLISSKESRPYYSVFGQLIIRPTGFFEEPSTFVGAMMIVLASLSILKQQIDKTLSVVVSAIGVLSFSTAAWLFSAVLFFIVLWTLKPALKLAVIAVLVPCVFSVAGSLWISSQVSKYERTSDLRTSLFTYAFKDRPLSQVFFGPITIGTSQEFLISSGRKDNADTNVFATNHSLGTGINWLLKYGLFGAFVYLLCMYVISRTNVLPVFMLVLLVTQTKITPEAAFFGLLLAPLLLRLCRRDPETQYRIGSP